MIDLLRWIVEQIIDPWTILVFLILLLGYQWIRRRRDVNALYVFAPFIWIGLIGFTPLPTALIHGLETEFSALDIESLDTSRNYTIVVLGSGHVDDPDVHALSTLGVSAAARLTEGARIFHALPFAELVTSGIYPFPGPSHAEVMKDAAISLAIPPDKISTLPGTANTMEEAQAVSNFDLGSSQLILVTSASHMPRAIMAFRSEGLAPRAAPTDFRLLDDPDVLQFDLRSPSDKFSWFRRALHEYIGIWWYSTLGT